MKRYKHYIRRLRVAIETNDKLLSTDILDKLEKSIDKTLSLELFEEVL